MMRSFKAEPFELEIMQQAFDTFCDRNDITARLDRGSVALQVTKLYSNGARTLEDLYAGLRLPLDRKASTQEKLLYISSHSDTALDVDELLRLQNSGLITLTLAGWALTSAGRLALDPSPA